jgi:LysM repeat protein
MFVWSGSAWVSVATEVESLATYATQSYADNQPGMKLIVPSSIAVGSGSGSVSAQGAVTFSSASSVSINGCFNSTYENYRVLINWTGTTDEYLYIRLRSGTTDNTSTNYYSNSISMLSNATTVSGTNFNAVSYGIFGYQGASVETSHLDATIFSPQNSTKTTGWVGQSTRWGGSVSAWRPFGGSMSVTTSYDGFTIYPGASGNVTGTLRIYGLKNG